MSTTSLDLSYPIGQWVVVTAGVRNVRYGRLLQVAADGRTVRLGDMRPVFSWTGGQGIGGLATIGPQSGSRIGPPVPSGIVSEVSTIFECTPAAVDAWARAGWAR